MERQTMEKQTLKENTREGQPLKRYTMGRQTME